MTYSVLIFLELTNLYRLLSIKLNCFGGANVFIGSLVGRGGANIFVGSLVGEGGNIFIGSL